MKQYIISSPAIQDLQVIIDYFSETSVVAGEKFISKFEAWCQKLRTFPTIGKRYDGLQLGLRGIVIDEYILFYQVTDNVVEIIRVVHGRRDLITLFNQE